MWGGYLPVRLQAAKWEAFPHALETQPGLQSGRADGGHGGGFATGRRRFGALR